MHFSRGPRYASRLVMLCLLTAAPLAAGPAAHAAALGTVPATTPAPPLSVDLGDGVRLELLLIRPGTYVQGSPPTEAGRADDEAAREVTLSQPFYVGRTAVTRAQFGRFVAETRYRTEAETGTSGGYGWDGQGLSQRNTFNWRNPGFPQDGDHPVCLVTHPDAEAFCRWLSAKAGRAVALPTEAQWEYACRAGTTSPWHNGAADPQAAAEVAWSKQTADNATHAVTRSKPNAWGLHIGGNVSEWCQDWYGPYAPGPVTDPVATTPPAGEKPRRVRRGGSWNRDAKTTRSAARFRADPRSRNADIGFRVVAAAGDGGTGAGTVGGRSAATGSPSDAPATAGIDQAASNAAPLSGTPSNVTPPAPIDTPPVPAPPAGPGGAGEPSGNAPPSHEGPADVRGGDGGFPWLGAVCGVLGLGGLAVVVLRFLRGLGQGTAHTATGRPPGTPAAGPQGVVPAPRSAAAGHQIRLAADGFWLLLPGVAPGSRVHYTYLVAGGPPTSDSIYYGPGPQGHFVYTGGTPQSARVLNVEAGDGGPGLAETPFGGPGLADTSGETGFATGLGLGSAARGPSSMSRPQRTTSSTTRSSHRSSSSSSSSTSSSHRPSAY